MNLSYKNILNTGVNLGLGAAILYKSPNRVHFFAAALVGAIITRIKTASLIDLAIKNHERAVQRSLDQMPISKETVNARKYLPENEFPGLCTTALTSLCFVLTIKKIKFLEPYGSFCGNLIGAYVLSDRIEHFLAADIYKQKKMVLALEF